MIEIIISLATTLIITLLIGYYSYKKWAWTYWDRQGLNVYEPKSFKDLGDQFYEAYFHFKKNGQKHGGTYIFFQPMYIPVDLDLIKEITIGDFDHFVNRGLMPYRDDDAMSAHLFNLEDQHWKISRSKLSPTFTSGKIKMMFDTVVNTTQGLEEVLRKYSSSKQPIEMKDTVARYTTDVILSVAFGIEARTLKNPNSEFRSLGKIIMENLDFSTVMLFLFSKLPWPLQKLLFILRKKEISEGLKKKEETKHFFRDALLETVAYREENNIRRNDFLHLLLLLKNKGKLEEEANGSIKREEGIEGSISLNELISHCFLFFIGGFDTSSTSITYTLFELAENPEIQERLREEIHEAMAENDGKWTYDVIMNMKYLDKVVNESLRLHPPVKFLIRKCKQDYQVRGTNFTLKKNQKIIVPVWAIHDDPELYPEPHKFDPERFSPENKALMHSLQHIPFGEGPRMCIGSRFGYLQVKVGLISILNKFRVSLNEKTQLPLKTDKSFFATSVKGGIWFNIKEI